MSQSLKLSHIFALVVGSILVATASITIATETGAEPRTLIECHDLLPDGIRYDFKITSDIDTRKGQKGKLSVSLLDAENPESHEVPDGAGAFLQCVQKVVGVGDGEGWPEV